MGGILSRAEGTKLVGGGGGFGGSKTLFSALDMSPKNPPRIRKWQTIASYYDKNSRV